MALCLTIRSLPNELSSAATLGCYWKKSLDGKPPTKPHAVIETGATNSPLRVRFEQLIRLGDVVRKAEPNFRIAECFDAEGNTCVIARVCSLGGYWTRLSIKGLYDDCNERPAGMISP